MGKQDKAKAPERPPGLGAHSAVGEPSEEAKPDGISTGENSVALANLFTQQEARIDEKQQELFTQQDARMNELFEMVQALAHACRRWLLRTRTRGREMLLRVLRPWNPACLVPVLNLELRVVLWTCLYLF
ncbi:hypothetical protein CYMTET_30165 [Cymbomonas tetramitiformis]|uniref:Uncharacterized protein n=1 Tax=Cymbomonas tetramitiformis TaxID=36881 RepID=A0AAE0FJI2_9CHLO|nr:hypothetical protein CYMTET_30165 [Cymbomonas tetramitiformis]